MFKDAKQVLRHGGELRIIGNRQLPYGNMLKTRYGGFTVIGMNAKCSICSTYLQQVYAAYHVCVLNHRGVTRVWHL